MVVPRRTGIQRLRAEAERRRSPAAAETTRGEIDARGATARSRSTGSVAGGPGLRREPLRAPRGADVNAPAIVLHGASSVYTPLVQRKIKLIWDFRGTDAQGTAEHHARHLGEFARREALAVQQTGAEALAPNHWIAWLIAEEDDVTSLRAALRPSRGLEA